MKLSLILKHRVSICFILLLLMLSLRGQGNPVFNGGFDVNASGWILANGATMADLLKGDPGGWVDLQTENPTPTTPTASQTISGLVPGQIYIISGDFKKTIDWSSGTITGLSFGVAIDSKFLFEAADTGDYDWHSFNFDYTAASASVLLSLSAEINGTEVNYGIDNIAMNAIPEPSSICLIFLGSGLLIYVRKRRRNAAQT